VLNVAVSVLACKWYTWCISDNSPLSIFSNVCSAPTIKAKGFIRIRGQSVGTFEPLQLQRPPAGYKIASFFGGK